MAWKLPSSWHTVASIGSGRTSDAGSLPVQQGLVDDLRKRSRGWLFSSGFQAHRAIFRSTLLKMPGRSSSSTGCLDHAVPAGSSEAWFTMKSLIPCGVFGTLTPERWLSILSCANRR